MQAGRTENNLLLQELELHRKHSSDVPSRPVGAVESDAIARRLSIASISARRWQLLKLLLHPASHVLSMKLPREGMAWKRQGRQLLCDRMRQGRRRGRLRGIQCRREVRV